MLVYFFQQHVGRLACMTGAAANWQQVELVASVHFLNLGTSYLKWECLLRAGRLFVPFLGMAPVLRRNKLPIFCCLMINAVFALMISFAHCRIKRYHPDLLATSQIPIHLSFVRWCACHNMPVSIVTDHSRIGFSIWDMTADGSVQWCQHNLVPRIYCWDQCRHFMAFHFAFFILHVLST